MMEMKRTGIAVVAAEPTGATSFGDQPQLGSPAPFDDSLLTALLTPIVPPSLEHEGGQAVGATSPYRLSRKPIHNPNTSSGAGRNQASSAVPARLSAPPDDFSMASVFDSICRTRSRVTPTSWPMSSSVIGGSPPRP